MRIRETAIYCHIYSFFYRIVMRTAHRFDWHHAPKLGPILPDGDYQYWCQWCGMRAIEKAYCGETPMKVKRP